MLTLLSVKDAPEWQETAKNGLQAGLQPNTEGHIQEVGGQNEEGELHDPSVDWDRTGSLLSTLNMTGYGQGLNSSNQS